jgi:RNA polymerase sigma-70 factor (ECF subfamily)
VLRSIARPAAGAPLKDDPPAPPPPDFASVYDEWIPQVARWIRALGGLSVDIEDVAQEVFLVVRRKLDGFDGRNLGGWLYRITELAVRDHKRRAWFRHTVHKDHAELGHLEDPRQGVALLEHQDELRLLGRVLERMDETRRAAFVLFEVEGYSGEEIARLQNVPVATVWTRLHYARKEFFALMAEARGRGEGEAGAPGAGKGGTA